MGLDWHAAMAPQMKTERANSTDDRHHGTKKKPNRYSHVLGRFSVFGSITKWTGQGLLCRKQNGYQQY